DIIGGTGLEAADEFTQKLLRLVLELVLPDLARAQAAGGNLGLQPRCQQLGLMLVEQGENAVGIAGNHSGHPRLGRSVWLSPKCRPRNRPVRKSVNGQRACACAQSRLSRLDFMKTANVRGRRRTPRGLPRPTIDRRQLPNSSPRRVCPASRLTPNQIACP